MSDDSSRRRFLAVVGSTTIAALAGCSGADGDGDGGGGTGTESESMDTEMTETDAMTEPEPMDDGMTDTDTMDEELASVTVTVRVENVAPTDFYGAETPTGGAIWLTPGAFAIHTDENPLFTEGEAASTGLEALAEAGTPTGFENEPGLLGELQQQAGRMGVVAAGAYTPDDTVADPADPMGEVPGAPPIAPGGALEFDIEAAPGQRLSFASMFVPSNDVFVAPALGVELWPDGDVTERVDLWDAGTEPNTPPGEGPDQAPAQDTPTQGADENGVVRRLADVDDSYEYPAASDVVRVTLTPDGGV
ncbi:spondin domain-containing protein [Haloplanus sp.]|uniref:spondin domain-containing protein n=1 Tax=Haloplanus sp. TaxID=1961696 RepID=UPI002608F526|nr:spondin domain-containing protein [Haloplanus sp.]